MPIYAYRCDACGHRQDVLQKMSDPTLSVCPACGAESFARQLSAPAFQLKGTGWYVTDFRDNGKKAGGEAGKSSAGDDNGKAAEPKVNGTSDGKSEGKSDGASGGAAGASATPAVAPAASTPKAGAPAGTAGGPSAG
jgi:putative FmdB family regulatory protein